MSTPNVDIDTLKFLKKKKIALLRARQRRQGLTPLNTIREHPKQLALTMCNLPNRWFLGGNRPLDEDTSIWMADGSHKLLKEVVVGDRVVDCEGKRTVVTGIPFTGFEDTLKITMTTGEEVVCTSDHEFLSIDRHNRHKRFRPASEIRPGYFICRGKVEYPKKDLCIDPWLVGFLIGDGCLGKTIRFATADKELLPIISKLVEPFRCEVRHNEKYKYDYAIATTIRKSNGFGGSAGGKNKNMLLRELDGMGLMWKNSFQKRVPPEYMTASLQQRLELLAGLVDSDGSVCARSGGSAIDFCTVSDGLREDVCRLVSSLGGRWSVQKKYWKQFSHFRIYFRIPFLLPLKVLKKKSLLKKSTLRINFTVASIVPCGKRNVRCISVGSDQHSFILTNGIISSNTGKTEWNAHEVARFLHKRHPVIPLQGPKYKDRSIEGWSCCPSYDVQEETTQPKILECLDQNRILDTSKLRGDILLKLRYKADDGTHSILNFKSYEQGRSKFQGAGKDFVSFDEEPPKDVYEEAVMRSRAGFPLYAFCSMTPVNGMTWVYNEIYLRTDDPRLKVVTAEWNDNIFLSEDQKLEMAARYTPDALLVREKGLFVQRTGLVCSWWNRSVHLVDDIMKMIPKGSDVYCGIDFGYSQPCAVVYIAVDHDNNRYIFDGFYKTFLQTPQIADIMKRKEKDMIHAGLVLRSRFGDSAAPSDIAELTQLGLPVIPVKKETGESRESWDEYRARLFDYLGRIQPGTGKPKVFASTSLVAVDEKAKVGQREYNWFVNEVENLRWDEIRQSGVITQKPMWSNKCAKHAIDAWSYIEAMFAAPPETEEQIRQRERENAQPFDSFEEDGWVL